MNLPPATLPKTDGDDDEDEEDIEDQYDIEDFFNRPAAAIADDTLQMEHLSWTQEQQNHHQQHLVTNHFLKEPTESHQHHHPLSSALLKNNHSRTPLEQIIPFDSLPFSQLISPNNRYSCPICFMEFTDKRNFRHHYMVHSGEKPYACSHCPYRARQTGTLNKHVKLRHPQTLVLAAKVLK